MGIPSDDDLLEVAASLAQSAARAILTVRARGFEVSAKSDDTPVTAADHAAEAIIVAGLREAFPSIPVIAEEEVASGRTGFGDLGRPGRDGSFWLVDPLDGTREFACGRDHFTVNVGLVRNGEPVLGAVALPAFGTLYLGRIGAGARLRDASGERRITTRRVPDAGLHVLASRHRPDDPRLGRFLRAMSVSGIENIGSAVKFVRIAEGTADLHPRFGRTMEWDTAAPQAVLEAAGGVVLDAGGARLGYGKAGFENPSFVCWGRRPDGGTAGEVAGEAAGDAAGGLG